MVSPAQNTPNVDDDQKNTPTTSAVGSVSGKERELSGQETTEAVSEITTEVEVSKEVERAGVEVVKDTIELPPDVKKLGVTQTGPSAPVSTTTTLPSVTLPISDQQVVAGLHAQILNSLRWLAIWCMKRLKKAHIALKNMHGKIVRVRS